MAYEVILNERVSIFNIFSPGEQWNRLAKHDTMYAGERHDRR